MKLYKINPSDNVAVAIEPLTKGEHDLVVTADEIPSGHKAAVEKIARGEHVIKYGASIGVALSDIEIGQHVHTHNLRSDLSAGEYVYNKKPYEVRPSKASFLGFDRGERAGIRNYLFIVATVGCVNGVVNSLASWGASMGFVGVDAVVPVTHQFGCSQLGDDQASAADILAGIIKNPNAGGVLVVGLGCENSNIGYLKPYIGETTDRIDFMECQSFADEIAEGKSRIKQLARLMKNDKRVVIDANRLVIGLKCGGSDGYSGITANPLIGLACDYFTGCGGSVVMTEVPEMFGAEERLFERCDSEDTFDKAVSMINGFKKYFISHNQPINENPSPGNKAGGITTLEEKSLGCTQKSGKSEVTDVLEYGGKVKKKGLTLLSAPGNDIVAASALSAAGVNLILFSTGRGTPLGSTVPVIKVSSNTALALKKSSWIDFDAGSVLHSDVFDAFIAKILSVASGEKTKTEQNGCYDFAFFKNGVTL